MNNPIKITVSDEEMISLPLSEYVKLTNARMGIDLIGSSLGKYGPNDSVCAAVCKMFGYEYKEDVAPSAPADGGTPDA